MNKNIAYIVVWYSITVITSVLPFFLHILAVLFNILGYCISMSFLGISIINVFAWVLFGLVVGSFAYSRDPYPSRGGFVATLFFAVFGAFAGGYLTTFLLDTATTDFNPEGFFTAIGSAILLVIFYRFAFHTNNLT